MNSKSLRRLAGDHAHLHAHGLPPSYLWPPESSNPAQAASDDLTTLSVLLAGPEGTPYAAGLFQLSLSIPPTYPTNPPTANFKTRIWHPNVDENTGAICVETLKRDWDAKLTLRHVLLTIFCLLVQPNPDSALNAESGRLLVEDFAAWERRAKLMTNIHAGVPKELKAAVTEARTRGEEKEKVKESSEGNKDKGKALPVEAAASNKAKRKADVTMMDVEEEENVEQPGLRRRRTNSSSASRASSDWVPAPAALADPFGSKEDNIFGIHTELSNSTASSSSSRIDGQQFTLSFPMSAHERFTFRSPITTPSRQPMASELNISNKLPLNQTPPPKTPSKSESIITFSWLKASPSDGDPRERERAEKKIYKAAGYCLTKYNKGHFGPRTGLRRL